MEVGKRIVELRERKNISTNKLANLAGISQSYLRDIEMGKKNPTVEMLSYICFALDISLQDFFTEQKNQINPYLLSAIGFLNDEEQTKLSEFICTLKKDNKNF
ncbi:MAG: helix-turn-helix transcriptional regulator [Oscillospiraceae bacterium]|nr:helix-turn-helix transcriptional regulator [Oscillospiraceae bacterium]